jgi:hypothetical protein
LIQKQSFLAVRAFILLFALGGLFGWLDFRHPPHGFVKVHDEFQAGLFCDFAFMPAIILSFSRRNQKQKRGSLIWLDCLHSLDFRN